MDRLGEAVEAGHRVKLARERARSGGPDPFDDLDCFLETVHSDARSVEWHPCLVIFRLRKSSAEAELKAALREQVEGGCLFGEHHRVAIVVGADKGANP